MCGAAATTRMERDPEFPITNNSKRNNTIRQGPTIEYCAQHRRLVQNMGILFIYSLQLVSNTVSVY